MFKRFRIVFMCIAALLAAPCIPDAWADEVPQSVPRDMVRLLHKDTKAFAYIESVTELAESSKVLLDSIGKSKQGQAIMSEFSTSSTVIGSR